MPEDVAADDRDVVQVRKLETSSANDEAAEVSDLNLSQQCRDSSAVVSEHRAESSGVPRD